MGCLQQLPDVPMPCCPHPTCPTHDDGMLTMMVPCHAMLCYVVPHCGAVYVADLLGVALTRNIAFTLNEVGWATRQCGPGCTAAAGKGDLVLTEGMQAGGLLWGISKGWGDGGCRHPAQHAWAQEREWGWLCPPAESLNRSQESVPGANCCWQPQPRAPCLPTCTPVCPPARLPCAADD